MKKILMLLALLFILHETSAQNYKFQALFVYNIAQRIEWPNISGEFVIGVIGSKQIERELDMIAQKKKMFGNNIKVLHINTNDLPSATYHILYIDRNSSSKLDEINSIVSSHPTLVITDKSGLTGGAINFIDNSSKIEFEIFPSVIKSHQLNVSNSLLNLGIVKR